MLETLVAGIVVLMIVCGSVALATYAAMKLIGSRKRN